MEKVRAEARPATCNTASRPMRSLSHFARSPFLSAQQQTTPTRIASLQSAIARHTRSLGWIPAMRGKLPDEAIELGQSRPQWRTSRADRKLEKNDVLKKAQLGRRASRSARKIIQRGVPHSNL
jgi:hypothetical protein